MITDVDATDDVNTSKYVMNVCGGLVTLECGDIADLYEALAEIAAEDADRTEEQQAEDYAASLAGEPR